MTAYLNGLGLPLEPEFRPFNHATARQTDPQNCNPPPLWSKMET